MKTWVLLLIAAEALAETPTPSTVCRLAERPETFAGRIVSVRAEVDVFFERQALIDHACPERQIWFEIEEGTKTPAPLRTPDMHRKVTANVTGRFETGRCFGHSCFSHSQLRVMRFANVTAVERRFAPDFSTYDCRQLLAATSVKFRNGPQVETRQTPLRMRRLAVVLTDPSGTSFGANAAFEIAITPERLKSLNPRSGIFRLPGLMPGAYAFSAVAPGFQSLRGCMVIDPAERASQRIELNLPYGI